MIDDDPAAHMYHKIMIGKAGLPISSVTEYTDGKLALFELKQLHAQLPSDLWPEVILIDINMPGIDGWTFVDELKSMALGSKLPKVFLVSNSEDPADLQRAQSSKEIVGIRQKFLDVDFFRSLPQN